MCRGEPLVFALFLVGLGGLEAWTGSTWRARCAMGWFAPERKPRQSIRLKGYDYSRRGAYSTTVCV